MATDTTRPRPPMPPSPSIPRSTNGNGTRSQDMFRDMMSTRCRARRRSPTSSRQSSATPSRAPTAVAAWAQLAQDAISVQRAALGRGAQAGLEAASHIGRMGRTGASA